jgi:hypothetical protein
VIKEAGRLLREKSPVEDFQLKGWVIELTRPDESLHGKALLLTTVDNEPRKITIELWEDNWELANHAMKERLILSCEGELFRDSKPFQLKNPRNLRHVLKED